MSAILKQHKEAFDKIRSNLEKKRILSQLAVEKGEVICKGDGESLFGFIPMGFVESEGLQGKMMRISDLVPRVGEIIIANFTVGHDRYFMRSQYGQIAATDILRVPDELFLLQRRAHSRVVLPNSASERGVNIIKHNGKVIFAPAVVHDVSAGGCRIVIDSKKPMFSAGDKITAVLHINEKWRVETHGEIRHCTGSDKDQNFGVQFSKLDALNNQKLQMMMLELQRLSILHGR
jgi:hypothetical protein